MKGQREIGPHGKAIRTGNRENAQDNSKEPGQQDTQPHVGRRGEDIADGRDGVVEPLAPRRKRAEPVSGEPAQQDRRKQQNDVIGHGPRDDLGHRRGKQINAYSQIALQQTAPEVEVLLPDGKIQAKEVGVIIVHHLSRVGVHRGPRQHVRDRIAGHEARDHPVDGHGQKKGQHVDEDFSAKIASHKTSSVTV